MLTSHPFTLKKLTILFSLDLETKWQTTEIRIIVLNNIAIKRMSSVKFLGVIIDEHLIDDHINLVKPKVAKMTGVINRLTIPSSALRTLYNAFILPCLNYGIIVWGGGYSTPLQPIDLLQKRAVRYCNCLWFRQTTTWCFMYNQQRRSLPPLFDDYSVPLFMIIFLDTSLDFRLFHTKPI